MAWTSPRTWVAGESPSASTLNIHVRDQFKALGDAWTTGTGTWASTGTAPAIGNGSIGLRYRQIGKNLDVEIRVTMGSTTTFGTGNYSLGGLPVGPLNRQLLRGDLYDASANQSYPVWFSVGAGSTSGTIRRLPTTAGNSVPADVAATVPFTFAQDDLIVLRDSYETA